MGQHIQIPERQAGPFSGASLGQPAMTTSTQAEVHDVFISYKRKSAAAQARLIRTELVENGVRVFMDVTDLGSGFFDEALLQRIANTRNFVLILAPHSLDNCMEETDWLRKELGQAIASGCNIVPIRLPNFKFPKTLPDELRDLPRLQSLEYTHVFFEAMVDRLLDMLDLPASAARIRQPTGEPKGDSVQHVRRWLLTGCAAAILLAVAVSVVRYERNRFIQARILQVVATLRLDFAHAVNAAPGARGPLIAAVQSDVDAILRLDPRNGSGLYFQGEAKRLANPAMFTEKRCLIPGTLKNQQGELDYYEDDFFHYLDLEANLPTSETSGGTGAELCYSRASGFCQQRTAWVSHLLANDLYQEALYETNAVNQAEFLKRALAQANQALTLYQDKGSNQGFTQCMPTAVLIRAIQDRMKPAAH